MKVSEIRKTLEKYELYDELIKEYESNKIKYREELQEI